jgi:4-amino-4-deoxy-L-arabinose transferase-like glycosyltransferase
MSWVGGSPFLYPVFSAFFYQFGGILGSRFFSVILGTFDVFLMYQFTKQLFYFRDVRKNKKAGLIAATFMAVTTVSIVISRLAIYDSLSFTLFFLGIVVYHKAIYNGEKTYYTISAVILFSAFLAKYVILGFFPLLIALPLILAIRTKNKESIMGIIFSFCVPLLLLTGGFIFLNFTQLQEFFVGQGVVSKASDKEVVQSFFSYTWLAYVFFLIGAPLLWRGRRLLIMLLLLFSLIPLLIHTLTSNVDSVQQHSFLSVLFIMPVVGAMFVVLQMRFKKIAIIAFVLVLAVQIFVTTPQVKEEEFFWANLTGTAKAIQATVGPGDRILAESSDSLYLTLKGKVTYEQIEGPFNFSYAGKDGTSAYTQAVDDGYFTFVELENGTYFSDDDLKAIQRALKKKYKKIYDDGNSVVYKKTTT